MPSNDIGKEPTVSSKVDGIVKVRGLDLYYRSNGSGFPLVFVSGMTRGHEDWIELEEKLTPYYNVITYDNIGIGRSSSPDIEYSSEMLADLFT